MPSRSSISESFLLLDSLRTVEQARQLIGVAAPRYLVVEVEGARHVLAARDFEARVGAALPSATLRESGLLAGSAAAAVRTWAEAATCDVAAPCLVEENGLLVGVLARRQGGRLGLLQLDRPRWDHGAGPADAAPRYISAVLPETLFTGERVLLAVQLGSRESPLPLSVPDGATITVVVHAADGITVEGHGTDCLRVPEDGTVARAEFWLRAGAPGVGTVRVLVVHEGRLAGMLDLHPAILPRPGVPARELPTRHRAQVAALDAAATPGADLSLLIFEETRAGKPVLRIRVAARDPSLNLNYHEFGSIALRLRPMAYFHAFFADITAVGERSVPEVASRKLEMRGARLFETLLPQPLQALLWELRDRVTSLEIHSEEAWIPWELCRLTGQENGQVRSGPFFCEAFEITRWIPGIARRPRLTLNHLAVVAPGASGLPAVDDEVAFLRTLEADGRSVRAVPARYMDVWEALGSGEFDGFHFAGHGSAAPEDADRAGIALEEGERLRAEEICGELRNLGRSQPLIFLNACHGARGGTSLVNTGGWARGFLRMGAGAFVGAYWAVADRSAAAFARAFYREVRAGRTLGAAVRAARLEIRSDSDPTWLAYTVYCDPHAAVRG